MTSESASDYNSEKIEILHGAENIIRRTLEDLLNVKESFVNCTDYTGPSVFLAYKPMWDACIALKQRGVKLRFITEFTKDNIHECKEVMRIFELRHLDGIKGNFGIADGKDYGGAAIAKEGAVPTQLIRSNVKTFVEQQQYFFETLWTKATPAKQKIREIEEGIIPIQTKILNDENEIIKEIRRLNNSASKLSICSAYGGMEMSYKYFFDTYKRIADSGGMRCIVNINKRDSMNLIKVFLNAGIQVRHVKNMPPMNFGVSDKELAATIENMEGGKMSQSFLISNEPLYTSHFTMLFEELWKNGVDAKDRIRDIELGAEWGNVEVIPISSRARVLYLDLVKKANKEIIIMFPTTNAFIRQKNMGVIQFSEDAARQRKVKVRILMPSNESTQDTVRYLKEKYAKQMNIRYIEQMLGTRATILVVDRKECLVMELRDDSKTTFDEAIGLSTYSNSKAGVLSYVAIFESLWDQTELYQEIKKAHEVLKLHDKAQRMFINIAAHELRTPIQPIIGLSQILLSKTGSIEQYSDHLNTINRNAKRLNRLSDDILDVTKIESNTLELRKEQFNLNDVIINIMDDTTLGKKIDSKRVQLVYQPQDILLNADKGRIIQVISNLLSNAIEFTKDGFITISIK